MLRELNVLTQKQAEEYGIPDDFRIALNNIIETVVEQEERIQALEDSARNR